MSILPKLKTEIPGPESKRYIAELAEYESPAITARSLARAVAGGMDCPIVWKKTQDVFVEDVDGNRFIDLTSGFGVAGLGHANPKLVAAAQQQIAELPHAMGDAFPAHNKVLLAKRLAEITPGKLKRTLFANAGFEAVEAALKTAMIKTTKPGVIAFEDAYHGLGYGALAVTSYRDRFREPFLSQLNQHIYRLPYPTDFASFKQIFDETLLNQDIGALIIEPILGRGGIIEASHKALHYIRQKTAELGIVMIVDEIYTGFGRTGTWFAVEHFQIVPDILCVGKALSGGFPISAAIGTDEVMSGWGDAKGEAIHTSTFLGNPVGCAMALASIEMLENEYLAKVNAVGSYFKERLQELQSQFPMIAEVRGRGLMLGVEFLHDDRNFVLKLSKDLLQRGLIALPCGLHGNILGFTPPFTLQEEQVDFVINKIYEFLFSCHSRESGNPENLVDSKASGFPLSRE